MNVKHQPSVVSERMVLRPLMAKDARVVQRLARSRSEGRRQNVELRLQKSRQGDLEPRTPNLERPRSRITHHASRFAHPASDPKATSCRDCRRLNAEEFSSGYLKAISKGQQSVLIARG